MGAWRYRVAKDDNNKLHFVFARYDDVDRHVRRGIVPGVALNEGNTVDDMRRLAQSLLAACNEPIISLEPNAVEPHDDDEGEDEPLYD
jgi:hypothetical protein